MYLRVCCLEFCLTLILIVSQIDIRNFKRFVNLIRI